MRTIVSWMTVMILGLSPLPVHAAKRAGVTLPETVKVAGTQLTLNGMGLREATFLKVDVYVAGLYVQNVSSNPAELLGARSPKLLLLQFVRDVDRDDIVKAWSEGFRGNATVPIASIQTDIDQLNTWMPRFRRGDTLAFLYLPDGSVAVEVNHVRKGVIKGEGFATSLFSIWLGRHPPTTALKRDLLGTHPRPTVGRAQQR